MCDRCSGIIFCAGTHDFANSNMQLLTKPITIKNSFIGVRSMILPNIVIGENRCWCSCRRNQKCSCEHQIVVAIQPTRLGKEKFQHELI